MSDLIIKDKRGAEDAPEPIKPITVEFRKDAFEPSPEPEQIPVGEYNLAAVFNCPSCKQHGNIPDGRLVSQIIAQAGQTMFEVDCKACGKRARYRMAQNLVVAQIGVPVPMNRQTRRANGF